MIELGSNVAVVPGKCAAIIPIWDERYYERF